MTPEEIAMFGDAVPGEAVASHGPIDALAGYHPRGRFIRDGGGKWVRIDRIHAAIAKEQAMTTALVERPVPDMPKDQIDLIRRTVANGASNDELALFLYDCQRRGIHPLDKLLHFTKRGGKYTPVTSIDFMRAQAAMSGEMAGSDDPVFTMTGEKVEAATVTVYRLTQGQRFAYAATARWAEYCPDNASMWRKMPHTMLAKCAEALALRKAFPQQLAGLYSREEMDQADAAVIESPRRAQVVEPATRPAMAAVRGAAETDQRSEDAVQLRGASPVTDDGPDLSMAEPNDLPDGFRLIDDYSQEGPWHQVTWGRDAQGGWRTYKTKLGKIGDEARIAFERHEPVKIHSNKFPWLDKVERLGITREEIDGSKFVYDTEHGQ